MRKRSERRRVKKEWRTACYRCMKNRKMDICCKKVWIDIPVTDIPIPRIDIPIPRIDIPIPRINIPNIDVPIIG